SVAWLPDAVLGPASGPQEVAAAAQGVGFPLLVKASAGGGGRGIRLVASPDELLDAVSTAGREAAAAFGDPTLFLERYLPAPRHVEVQIFGDTAGAILCLGEPGVVVTGRPLSTALGGPRRCGLHPPHQGEDR